jgi:hypothetical protein
VAIAFNRFISSRRARWRRDERTRGGIVLLRVDQVALFYEGRQQLSLLLFGWKMRTKQVKSADFAEFERSSTEMQTTIYKAKAFVV